MAELDSGLDADIAHLPAVIRAVRDELDQRATRVQAVVDAHVRTGDLRASMRVRTSTVDSTVTLSDPAVLSINYGHMAPNGRFVEGIHAIEAGLA